MRLLSLIGFVLIFSFISVAQKTVINGVAPGAERKIIQITTPGDLITFWENKLGTSRVDSTGLFSLTVDLDKTINAVISIDFHKTEILLEPGKTYNFQIAPMQYDDYTEVNPFIQSQNLMLEMADPDPGELNTLIGVFNTVYSSFLMENFNALYRDRKKELLDTLRLRLNQHFGAVKNAYFLDYASYKIAALEQLTRYYNNAQLAKKYFTDKPILYNNLEYMEFFNSFFSKYMTVTSNTIRKLDIASLLKSPDPYRSMMKAMTIDSILINEQLRELVMLKGLMELYQAPAFDQAKVLAVFKTTAETSKFEGNRVVAEDMFKFLTKLTPGTKAPEFTLLDRDQKERSLKSLLGKPVVLCFWTTYCEGCLAEMDLIKPLFDKYQENIQFVSVSADKSFFKMLYFINLKKDYVWTFVNIGDQSEVLKDYDVRTYPLFVLIDKEGNIYKYPAAQPSNGLEEDIQRILQK
ncbi:MAG: TlpA disulfide reductase family protein [Bacteroidales bacterium]|nr:TlpA disulfide reductase family protein [Bacteroidales bacterium]